VPHVSGTRGGHDLSVHRFARDGIRLLGRVTGARGGALLLADDLKANLANVDRFEANFLGMIDAYIERAGLDAPPETRPVERDGYDAPDIRELDLEAAGIRHVIWASGYGHSYDFIRMPVTDEYGFPLQQSGVSEHPGLYFIGSTFLRARRSGILLGVPGDSEYIARHIAERSG
jgi:putative flavoprotein involved in K+ transport